MPLVISEPALKIQPVAALSLPIMPSNWGALPTIPAGLNGLAYRTRSPVDTIFGRASI